MAGLKKSKLKTTFPYGNYLRYYGYRNDQKGNDGRLTAFATRPELFYQKDVLDIGCNSGLITYCVSRDLKAKTVVGIDIDNNLIKMARKSSKAYMKQVSKTVSVCNDPSKLFPGNVQFMHKNYVPYDDSFLISEEPKFDVVLCLSITKWIHLNWLDEGLQRTFMKIYTQLRNGGVLILEAQSFNSYKKKKILPKLRANIEKLKLLPHMFDKYLIDVIGFKSFEELAVPQNTSSGFQRSIKIFYK